MARIITVGAAQLGPIAREEPRAQVVGRLLALMRQAKETGCGLVVYPELALTTFFPRWLLEDPAGIESFFEREMPNAETQALFDEARRLEIGFYLGYAESVEEDGARRHYNTSILVDKSGEILGKYRKIHLPGTAEVVPGRFPVWRAFGGILGMCICNDRRWPETYRVMGLQGVEMVLIGYNTPVGLGDPYELDALTPFHNHLSMQAGAYQNAAWVVGVAKAGCEEGINMIGQSCIIAPSGEIVAMCRSLGDELITYRCDLDMGRPYKEDIFNFAAHRRTEAYGLIVERTGAEPPPD
jgi:predicted amidohydrolase